MKAQSVRLFDVAILGPAMVYAGYKLRERPKTKDLGNFIAVAGIGTVLYNWHNYRKGHKTKGSS